MIEVVVLLSLSVALPGQPPQDPLPQVRRDARQAAYTYERLLRRRAPETWGGGGDRCHEIIGRFCFRFTDDDRDPDPPPPEEHEDIAEARTRAVATHRAWFALEPEKPGVAGPLVRYLIDDGRPREALAAARTHAWAAERTVPSLLILGLSLHHAGEFTAAEAVFDSVRSRVLAEERSRLDDVEVLLEPRERRVYRDLDPEAREAYNGRFWAFSDPSLQDGGNERRSAHYARHAWAMILKDAPGVQGRTSWGSDVEEILLRYGRPLSRARIRQPTWRLYDDLSMVESFDPLAVPLVPAALLTRGLPVSPEPGARGELERDTVRSSYAPIRLTRLRSLPVQAARFPADSGARLLVAGVLERDTAYAVNAGVPPRPRGLLVVLDTLGREVSRTTAQASTLADSALAVWGELWLGPGSYVYRLEVTDDSAGIGALSQYRIDIPAPVPPGLSDLLVAPVGGDSVPASRPGVSPDRRLVVPVGARLLVWAEASALALMNGRSRYAVEWWVERGDKGGIVSRAARWLGRRLGLGERPEPVRVRWEDGTRELPAVVALSVDLGGMDPGLYRLALTVRDRISGLEKTATRLFRIDPAAAPVRFPIRE
ncbi:MAG: hypothetical protein ACLFRX_05600 [Gemmatimonadota bacterium]